MVSDDQLSNEKITSETVFSSLKCPLCDLFVCFNGADCIYHPHCRFCHEKDHQEDSENLLIEYIKSDFLEGNKFTSPKNLIVAGLSSDKEVNGIVLSHIRDYTCNISSKKIESEPDVEYIEALIWVSVNNSIDDETLKLLYDYHPTSIHWARKRGKDLITIAEDIVGKYHSSNIPLNLGTKESSVYDYKKEVYHLLDEMNRLEIDEKSAKSIIKIFTDGFEQYGIIRQLDFLTDESHIKKYANMIPELSTWLVGQWYTLVSRKTKQNPNFLKRITLVDLENMEQKAAESKYYSIALIISSIIVEKAEFSSDIQKQKETLVRGLSYFERWEEPSNYINYCIRLINSGFDIDIIFPNWIEEKLLTSPEQIPKFDDLCRQLNVNFDYSWIKNNFNRNSFTNNLCYKHLSNIFSGDAVSLSPSNEEYKARMISGGNGSLENAIGINNHSQISGFTIDLPNMLYLAHERGRSSQSSNKDSFWEATHSIVDWINQLGDKASCYIHTTPFTCAAYEPYVTHIFESTNAWFIHYDWKDETNEDLYFILFSITNYTWIITQDSFQSHYNSIKPEILEFLQSRVIRPNYDKRTKQMSFTPPKKR